MKTVFNIKRLKAIIPACLIVLLAAALSTSKPAFRSLDFRGEGRLVESYLADFRNIPGVTPEEIQAVEGLKGETLAFGSLTSGEAFVGKDGRKAGFLIHFAADLSAMLGLRIRHEFVEAPDLAEALASGRIDLTCEVFGDKPSQEQFRTRTPILERQVMVIRLKGDEPANSPYPAKGRARRYGFSDGFPLQERVADYAGEKVESIFFSDYDEAEKALQAEEIDAFFDESPAVLNFKNYKSVVEQPFFPPLYSSLHLSTAKKELSGVISVVQKFLDAGGSEYLFELYDQSQDENMKIFFEQELDDESRQALEELKKKPPVRVAAKVRDYPESFYNEYASRFEGISIEVLEKLETVMGLKFEIVNNSSAEDKDLLSMLKDGRADLATSVDPFGERGSGLLTSRTPHSYDRYGLISLRDKPDLSIYQASYVKIGYFDAKPFASAYERLFPEAVHSVRFETLAEALEALKKGRIDYLMGSRNLLLNLTNYDVEPDLKLALIFEEKMPSCFGFSPDGETLRRLMDAAMSYVNLSKIQSQWNSRVIDYHQKFTKEIMPIFAAFVLLLLIWLTALLRMNNKNRRLNKNLEGLVEERTVELQEAKDELDKEKDLLSRILDTCPVSLVITQKASIRFLNPFARDFFGIEVGGRIEQAMADMEVYLKYYEEIQKKGHLNWLPIQLVKADGTVCESLVNCFQSEFRGEKAYINWITDVTELRNKAAELAQARENAENSSRAKSELLANMSHEIRTPMNAILGLSQLAQQTKLGEEQSDYVDKIESAAKSLLGIINDILDFSKIEAGKIEMESIVFKLEDVLNGTVNLFAFKAREKKLELILDVDPLLPASLVGDPLRLRQVLNNLMSNALKFTDKGTVRLAVEKKELLDDEAVLLFKVIDSGIGVSEEQKNKLFQAFSQADSSFTRRFGGTGLGLVISKSLVELMKGSIWLESSPGAGSLFAFTASFGRPEKDKEVQYAERRKDLRGLRVLVLESDPAALEVVGKYLRHHQVEAVLPDSPAAGVRLLQESEKGRFDAVIVSQSLTGWEGSNLTKAVRESGAGGKTPIILAVNIDRSQMAETAREEGVASLIVKPATLDGLAAALAEALGLGEGGGKKRKRESRGQYDMSKVAYLQGARILLAEDNEINQLVATKLLKNAGFEVQVASNGLQAVNMIQENVYDLVLMDIQMPQMDGLTATRTIRALPGYGEIPIIAMTAHAMRGDKEQSLEAGMNDHLTKPINLPELMDAMRRWIKKRRV
ncbi:MAG: response regulator [Deltaproteobacteria bacterium]|jgi:CheY-like chemotaxis protein|nr:response regulator [Deltaproteobacteria bacterium]